MHYCGNAKWCRLCVSYGQYSVLCGCRTDVPASFLLSAGILAQLLITTCIPYHITPSILKASNSALSPSHTLDTSDVSVCHILLQPEKSFLLLSANAGQTESTRIIQTNLPILMRLTITASVKSLVPYMVTYLQIPQLREAFCLPHYLIRLLQELNEITQIKCLIQAIQ